MSVPIIFDKSSFQGLNYGEIIELHRYYAVNVTPLLVNEILGDLSKEEKAGKNPKDAVVNLSKKMFPYNSYVNMKFDKVIEESLLGNFVENDNRPFLIATKSVASENRNGLIFKETNEELSIKRWKEGKFDSIDEIISDVWRSESQDDKIIEEFKNNFDHLGDIKVNNKLSNEDKLKDLKKKLRERLTIELEPEDVLNVVLDYFNISYDVRISIFERWNKGAFPDIEAFAEYVYYCYSIAAMYYLGIINNIYSERKTNLLDLQYLFYLPFAKVFSTNDKFLKSLFDVMQPVNVVFISLPDLKSDLAKFQKLNNPENWSEIPPDKNTYTYKIWDANFNLELSEKFRPSAKAIERATKEFEDILKLAESVKPGRFSGEPDFVLKHTYYSIDDPCPCKSGKALKDCHYKK